jgi:acyl carrier protein
VDSTIPVVREYILNTFLPGEDPQNLTPTTELMESGVLDSLATLDLVAFLEERFNIELQAHDVDSSKLGTLEAIDRLVRSKLAEPA